MKTQTRDNILLFIAKNERVSPKSILEHIGLSAAAVFKHLNRLLAEGRIRRHGKPPRVFYSILNQTSIQPAYAFDPKTKALINRCFIKIRPDGVLQSGTQAFIEWCLVRGLEPVHTSIEYAATIKKFATFKKAGLIDGTKKFQRTYSKIYLDRIYYLDFYSIERFGKTKLGELMLYAKQSQNVALIRLIVADIKPRIERLLKNKNIDAIGFIPPTVKRQIQFMKELEKLLHLPVKTLKISKIATPISIPQKTLNKLEDRIENARQSLVVEDRGTYRNILLIDDAIGSGATLNEVARQIRQRKLCAGKLFGLGLTGSFSGFEVVQEI